MTETKEPKVMHEWTLAGYHSRIVEDAPGIVLSEEAIDDDRLGRLWVSKMSPMGWRNEMIHLAAEVARLSALVPRWVPVWERRPLTAGDYRVCCGRSVHGRHGFHPASGWDPSPLPPTHWLEVPIPPLPGTETP